MAWQAETGSGTLRATDYRDLVAKAVNFMCSQHVATAVVNAGGSGYTTGDIVELQHASAHLYARFEVTAAAGAITGLRIISSGAYAQQAASATVGTGGSGYQVGDILEVQGGSFRIPARFEVATLSGSAVATVTLHSEGGGAYSSTPANDAATIGVGTTNSANTFAGDDACALTVTYQSIVGTSGLALTTLTGGGSSGTADITLAQTGWSVDSRYTFSNAFNSLTNEVQVTLVGDAAGLTNKPYIAFATLTRTSGINTRYAVSLHGMTAHNPALALSAQPGILGSPGTFNDDPPYILCDEDQAQEMDFWFSCDDSRICGVVNINPGAANTDDGEYFHFYAGFMDSFATESENPYPLFVGASSRSTNVDPSASSTNITGLSEALVSSGANTGLWWYRAETATWVNARNTENAATSTQDSVISPVCRITQVTGSTDRDRIVSESPVNIWQQIGSLNRSSPTIRLHPVPGGTPQQVPFPLTVLYRVGISVSETLDTPRGQLRGCFWVYNTDSAGATITNFSEDYITIGSDRYRVFHTHKQVQLYHYICIKEDV